MAGQEVQFDTSFFWVLPLAENGLAEDHCRFLYGTLAAATVSEEIYVAISLGMCECLLLLDFLVVFLLLLLFKQVVQVDLFIILPLGHLLKDILWHCLVVLDHLLKITV